MTLKKESVFVLIIDLKSIKWMALSSQRSCCIVKSVEAGAEPSGLTHNAGSGNAEKRGWKKNGQGCHLADSESTSAQKISGVLVKLT